ncbi:MAG: outer membrane protein transport protein, partial [Muribaculaceae bacterium]|nr:outer membrane protein transport protein [Muribaculaceae bacterium]
MIKQFIATALTLASSLSLMAEGYQVNTLSARQGGMAHTGTALKLGAESQLFNPAGMGFMDHTLDISASVSGVMATGYATIDGTRHETSNKVSTPLMASAAFSIYDFLKAGITIYTPYGSSINWTENWPGAVLNQSVDLATYTIQPTIAWKITPRLSIGAGLTIAWGNVNLNKGLVVPATVDMTLAAAGIPYRFGDTTPASVNLTGTATVATGYNIGIMYDITDRWTAGASYRSLMKMRVKAGNASVSYANDIARTALSSLDVLNEANFKAEMPMPATLSIGTSYRPTNKITLALDAQLTFWNAYRTLDIEFLSQQLSPYNQHLIKEYSNAWAFRLGAQY